MIHISWSVPGTAVTGQIITAAFWNTSGRDNLQYLKGQAGAIVVENALQVQGGISNSSGGATITGGIGQTGGGGIFSVNTLANLGILHQIQRSASEAGAAAFVLLSGSGTVGWYMQMAANEFNWELTDLGISTVMKALHGANQPIQMYRDLQVGGSGGQGDRQIVATKNGIAFNAGMWQAAQLLAQSIDGTSPAALGLARVGATAIALYHNGTGANALRMRDSSNNDYSVWGGWNQGSGSGLDADTLRTLIPGNGSGNIPINNSTLNTGLNADQLDGLDSTAFMLATAGPFMLAGAVHVSSGVYNGNNSSSGRQITTGYIPKLVLVYNATSGTAMWCAFTASASLKLLGSSSAANIVTVANGVHLHTSDGFAVGSGTTEANVSGETYNWVAFA